MRSGSFAETGSGLSFGPIIQTRVKTARRSACCLSLITEEVPSASNYPLLLDFLSFPKSLGMAASDELFSGPETAGPGVSSPHAAKETSRAGSIGNTVIRFTVPPHFAVFYHDTPGCPIKHPLAMARDASGEYYPKIAPKHGKGRVIRPGLRCLEREDKHARTRCCLVQSAFFFFR